MTRRATPRSSSKAISMSSSITRRGTAIVPLRIGCIGVGKIAETFHLPILRNIPQVSIAFLADIRAPNSLAREYNAQAFSTEKELSQLPECDAVFIATPVGVREPFVEEFTRRGVSIFTEKPFAIDSAQHGRWTKKNPRMMANYMRSSYGQVRQLRMICAQQPFGKLQSIHLSEGGIIGTTGKSKTHYQTDVHLSGGGVLMEKGCHLLSELDYILNAPPVRVKRPRIEYQDAIDVDAELEFTVRMNGKNVPVEFITTLTRTVPNLIRLEFEHAHVEWGPNAIQSPVRVNMHEGSFSLAPLSDAPRNFTQAFYLHWKQFIGMASRRDEWESVDSLTSRWTTDRISEAYRGRKRR